MAALSNYILINGITANRVNNSNGNLQQSNTNRYFQQFDITVEQAEQILQNEPDGSYIVRTNRLFPSEFIVSIKYDVKPENFLGTNWSNGVSNINFVDLERLLRFFDRPANSCNRGLTLYGFLEKEIPHPVGVHVQVHLKNGLNNNGDVWVQSLGPGQGPGSGSGPGSGPRN